MAAVESRIEADMDPYVAARQMDTDEIVELAQLRGYLCMLTEASYQSVGYRRVKNPRIWSMHDLHVLTGGPAMKWQPDGRMYASTIVAVAAKTDAGIVLRSPTVGLWRARPAPGALVPPGGSIGELEVLGVVHRLVAPPDAAGVVVPDDGERIARQPVDTRTALLTLDPEGSVATKGLATTAATANGEVDGLVFRAPLSGRYYARPAPTEDPFVKVGDEVEEGHTVALLEVMKTFNRITYGGPGLPARAKVLEILPADGDDVDEDDVLLRVEPA